LLGLAFLVAGFSAGAAQTGKVRSLAGQASIRLIALAFAMMLVAAFAIVMPAQFFLSKHLSAAP
jgi:hypothetical protein